MMMNMPVIDMTATGKNIVRLRLEAGLSVRELQILMGFSTPQAIYKWQHGAAMPNLDNLIALSAHENAKYENAKYENAKYENVKHENVKYEHNG